MVIDVEVPTYLLTSVAIAPFLVVTAFGVNLATEHIQAITHVKHGIAVDAVVASITASVGIRRGVIETSPAILVQIGRELETHGQSQHQLSAIAEAPGIEVGTGLQLIA